jgi:hypothetical protein
MKLNGEVTDRLDTVRYVGRVDVSQHILAGCSRGEFQEVLRSELRRLMMDLESSALEDWDKLHEDPLKDLITILADAQRAQHSRDSH